MFPPFLHIAIFYKDNINITSFEEPTWSAVDNILSVAYDSIMRINSTEMDRFYNKIIADLISYYKSVKQPIIPQVPSAIYVPNRNNIDTQTEINDLELQAFCLPHCTTKNTQTEENESELQVTSSNKRSQQSPDDTLITPRDVITKSHKRKKTTNQVIGENSNMVIVSEKDKVLEEHPAINTQIILDRCSFHLINTHEDVENFIQNDDNYILGLGSVHFGIGTLASITDMVLKHHLEGC